MLMEENVKKVLFVIPYLVEGGTERALSNITTFFPDDWQIDILVNDRKNAAYSFKGNIIELGFKGKPKTASVFFQAKVFFKRTRRLRQLKKRGDYQACVSFLDSANVANILSGKSFCKVIVSVRNSLVQQSRLPQYKYVVNPLVRLCYNYADKVIAVSKGIEAELKNNFGLKSGKMLTIENGYDFSIIEKQSRERLSKREINLFEGKKIVTTTGRLTNQKGQWHLIRAFSEVVKHVSDVLLVIIGSGELEDYLKELSMACHLEEHVYFTGHVSNPYKYLRCTDVFVLPSLYEGFPNALAEAVCMGLPCIATDFRTGARELLAPDMDLLGEEIRCVTEVQYGILTPVCSGKYYKGMQEPLELAEDLLADAVCNLIRDADKQVLYQEKSKRRGENLKIEAIISKWIGVIEEP